jgi:hypothetical protein
MAKEVKAVEAMDTLGMEVEGHLVLAPPPLTTLLDFFHDPPPFFHPKQVKIVFELRNQMVDQIHQDTLMHQRIDMLYDAFSNAHAAQHCSICVRPFMLQPRYDPLSSAPNDMPLSDNL